MHSLKSNRCSVWHLFRSRSLHMILSFIRYFISYSKAPLATDFIYLFITVTTRSFYDYTFPSTFLEPNMKTHVETFEKHIFSLLFFTSILLHTSPNFYHYTYYHYLTRSCKIFRKFSTEFNSECIHSSRQHLEKSKVKRGKIDEQVAKIIEDDGGIQPLSGENSYRFYQCK